MTAHPGPDDTALTGAWRTRDAPACADRYPDVLTFSTGTYLRAHGGRSRRASGGTPASTGSRTTAGWSPGEGLPPVTRRRELFALVRDDICPRLFPFL